MKLSRKQRFLALTTVASFSLSQASAEMRTFTNTEGNEISAEILEVQDAFVKLQRSDEKTFDIAITTLSEADQEYIQQWAEENVSYNFQFEVDKKTDTIAQSDGHGHQIESRAQKYEVAITQGSGETLSGADIQYKVFYRGETPSVEKKNAQSIASDSPLKFETKPNLERPQGIWIRIYLEDKVIGEYKSSSSVVKKAKWE